MTSLLTLAAAVLSLTSPNGQHGVEFSARSLNGKNQVSYTVTYRGETVIEPSAAGVHVDNRVWEMALGKRDLEQPLCWMDLLEADSVAYFATVDTTWTPLYGERSRVREHYNSATMYLSRHDKSKYRLNIEVRAYDEGIAFRYYFPEHPDAIFHKVTADLTEYTLPEGTMAWAEEWAQAPFVHTDVNSLTNPVERALTLQLPSGVWMALTDADVDDWCLTRYQTSPTKRNTLQSVMYSPVDIVTYYATPWKIVMSGNTPGELLEHNDIVNMLNPSCQIGDTSWIRPGKIMRETTLTNEGARATIDFCAAHDISYMLFDWKWYEPCTSHDGDATLVTAPIDMEQVVAYGGEKGVGVWLYVNQHALMKQMDELFPQLREWGIVGVKSGFVQYASHRWAVWLHDMVRKAADNQLMMNIHDEFRPSGFSRTYPNLLTQEGICGNEEWPDATHNVTLPFTRMINGAADYTICYYDKRLRTTHGHQLAASLVFYSPLLTVFWYDTPQRSNNEPELTWFDNLPTTWDDTRVLEGMPGENIVMARRKGDIWFVAAMTNNDARTQKVGLGFLTPGEKYVATLYTDDAMVNTATHVAVGTQTVTSKQTLTLQLPAMGGAAIRIEKIKK